MRGIVDEIRTNKVGEYFAFITDSDGNKYYTNESFFSKGYDWDDIKKGAHVDFSPGRPSFEGGFPTACEFSLVTPPPIVYYKYGYSQRLKEDPERITVHLKPSSGEKEILDKLKRYLYISYVNDYDLGDGTLFPYSLAGTTSMLKQFIRGQYEFLIVFSHFDNGDWQQNTIKAAKQIRHLRIITERRPLVNFYILISNARSLKSEIDRIKGGTDAAIIPFTFDEILQNDYNSLRALILSRFSEYYFENNMLGETDPIEEDTLLFGDRGKIADSIVERCKNGSHSGIFGLRRSGKTSVLKAVLRRLDFNEIKYAQFESRTELATLDSWKTALFDIAKKVRSKTLDIRQGDTESRVEFDERLGLNSSEEDYQKRATKCFVEDIKLYTRNLGTFVIAIDEIELITYNTATFNAWKDLGAFESFWGALRDCGCSLILCGVNSTINEQSHIEYKGKTCDNPMYERIHNCADFSKTYLPSFSDEQTKVMINTLGGYSNVAFNNVYVDINEAFGGQPYSIRQFCAFMFDQVKDQRKSNVLFEFSKAAFAAYIANYRKSTNGIEMFKTILEHIDTYYKSEYEMLKRIALSPDKFRSLDDVKDIRLIDHLEKYGLIEYDRTTSHITFNIRSLQDYIVATTNKRPEDMNNDERRRFIQDRVAECERKLKKLVFNYYSANGSISAGRKVISAIVKPNKTANPTPDSAKCSFDDLFKHSQFIMYFSSLKKIISNNWNDLGKAFDANGIDSKRFEVYMDDLNAGRTDADHYDAEDMIGPDEWEISDAVLARFMTAFDTFKKFFAAMGYPFTLELV